MGSDMAASPCLCLPACISLLFCLSTSQCLSGFLSLTSSMILSCYVSVCSLSLVCVCVSLVLPQSLSFGLCLSLTISFSLFPAPHSTCLSVGPDEWDHVSPCCPHILLYWTEGDQEKLCAVS